jgi:hypothetical protein
MAKDPGMRDRLIYDYGGVDYLIVLGRGRQEVAGAGGDPRSLVATPEARNTLSSWRLFPCRHGGKWVTGPGSTGARPRRKWSTADCRAGNKARRSAIVGIDATVIFKLWDVFDGTKTLVTRGVWRLTPASDEMPSGEIRTKLFGNAWRFAPGHSIELGVSQPLGGEGPGASSRPRP